MSCAYHTAHTYTYTHWLTHTGTHTHWHTHTLPHAHTLVRTHRRIHTHYSRTHTPPAHVYWHTHTHTETTQHRHTHMGMHACILHIRHWHTHTHTAHTHTHTHTLIPHKDKQFTVPFCIEPLCCIWDKLSHNNFWLNLFFTHLTVLKWWVDGSNCNSSHDAVHGECQLSQRPNVTCEELLVRDLIHRTEKLEGHLIRLMLCAIWEAKVFLWDWNWRKKNSYVDVAWWQGARLVSVRTQVWLPFLSLHDIVIYGHCLMTLLCTMINEILKWLTSLPILMRKAFSVLVTL